MANQIVRGIMASSLPAVHRAVTVNATGPSSVLTLGSIPLPTLTSTQVLVKNQYAGINYIDTYQRSGLYPVPLPITLGRDGAGEVVAVGDAVKSIKIGDKVSYYGGSGSYAEYTAVPGHLVAHVPDGIGLDIATAAMVQALTGIMLATQIYPAGPGDWVLVHAPAGGTGQVVTQVAAAAGANVIGVTSTPEKAALAKGFGAKEVFFYDDPDLVKKVKELSGGGVRAVYDGVGAATWETSKAVLGYLGTLITFGNASGKTPSVEAAWLTPNNIRLTRPSLMEAANASPTGFTDLVDKAFTLIKQGKLKLNVQKVYPLADAAKAHDDIEARTTTGKLLLDVGA